MFASGNTAAVLSQTMTPQPGSLHNYFNRQGNARPAKTDKMIPPNTYSKYGRRLSTDRGVVDGCRGVLPRLNSAPELHKPELPPILNQIERKLSFPERKHRPLTPLVNSTHQTTRSLPKNYRINLDLVPLVEVGPVGTCIGNLHISRRRQASLSSSDSCFSSSTPSPRLQKKSSPSQSPRPPSELSLEGFHKRASSTESLEEVDSDDEEADSKDTMILRWLQTVEKSHESTSELLPCITEGKLA